ncbi:MAG TPA: hypothetical protein VGC42_30345 [Kofleriaceae bacterium]
MRRAPAWSLLLLLGACDARIAAGSHNTGLGGVDASGGDEPIDAPSTGTPIDAGTADAAPGPFGPATPLTVAATTKGEDDPTLSSTGLEMIFAIDTGANGKDLYYTSRTTVTSPWSTPVLTPFSDTMKSDESPRFSADDKTLYFASAHNNRDGTLDIYSVTRTNTGNNTTWGTPSKLSSASTLVSEKWYMPCGTQFLLVRDVAGKNHFFGGPLGTVGTQVNELTSADGSDTGTFFADGCKTLYFASTRNPAATMIYVSHRDTVDSPWKAPTPVTDLKITGGNGNEEDPWLSPDGKTFVFVSDVVAANAKDVYVSVRP